MRAGVIDVHRDDGVLDLQPNRRRHLRLVVVEQRIERDSQPVRRKLSSWGPVTISGVLHFTNAATASRSSPPHEVSEYNTPLLSRSSDRSTTPTSSRSLSRADRRLVAIPDVPANRSLYLAGPTSSSRTMSKLQRPPTTSSSSQTAVLTIGSLGHEALQGLALDFFC